MLDTRPDTPREIAQMPRAWRVLLGRRMEPTLELSLWLAALADAAGCAVDLDALEELMVRLVTVAPVEARA